MINIYLALIQGDIVDRDYDDRTPKCSVISDECSVTYTRRFTFSAEFTVFMYHETRLIKSSSSDRNAVEPLLEVPLDLPGTCSSIFRLLNVVSVIRSILSTVCSRPSRIRTEKET